MTSTNNERKVVMNKYTAELEPGDVISYGGMRDKVIRVEWPDTERYPMQKVATLHFTRNDKIMWSMVGMMAQHECIEDATGGSESPTYHVTVIEPNEKQHGHYWEIENIVTYLDESPTHTLIVNNLTESAARIWNRRL